MKSRLVPLLFVVPLAGCASTGAERFTRRTVDLGHVPIELVELYDMAAPDGVIEIEIDRSGRVREMEADVPLTLVPAVVADAALHHLPAGRVTGAEREFTEHGPAWELKLVVEGREFEVVIDESGAILETEEEIDILSAPAIVLDAANATIQGGVLRSVELILRGDQREYHVKKHLLGVSYKVVIDQNGRVLRAVREARAEIEIPLRP